jgi:ATP-binding cassette, subfamily B (MDR/TAP), member 1
VPQIEIRGVRFSYPTKKDVQVLKRLDLDVQKNKVIALVGQSGNFEVFNGIGCGKSSIISMIERFYDPQSGEIRFQGTNIKDINPRWYHQQIAIVSQEPVLFSGSIRDNILYGLEKEGVTNERID